MFGKVDNRKKFSLSFLICCFLEEYVKLEIEVVVCKMFYEKVYVGVYGFKDFFLSQVLCDVLLRDFIKDLFFFCRREIC